MSEVVRAKETLRNELRSAIAGIELHQRAASSGAVVRQISQDDRWRRARVVMLYIPLPDELDILPLVNQALDHGKVVLIPRFNPATGTYEGSRVSNLTTDLVPGRFGIVEPGPDCPAHSLKRLDVTLVPGLGFDRVGRRLGRGKGYYDRLLAGASGEFWGIGLDCQLVTELPGESHDVVLNCIVTPAHWVEVVPARR